MQTITDDVTAINEAIAEKIGQQKFRIWFKNSTRMSLADGYLKVGVPNLFIGSWIENHFANEINEAVRLITDQSVKVIFNIDPELSGSQRRTQLDNQAQSVEKAPQRSPHQQSANVNTFRASPLKLNLDTFVVGPSNQLAYNAAHTIVNEKQSPFNPLFLHGGCGLGKTHLLQGICSDWAKKRPGAVWHYVSAEEFTNQYILSLKTKKLDAFRKRFRQADLLAIDDIHFLANKPSTQEEFLHTFNSVDMAGKQVVLASDAHPKMIGQLSESLINRFVSGMVVKIDAPDFATRCLIIRNRAAAMNKSLPENVAEYIAQNLKTNVRELEGALLKLVAFASLSNEKISLRMAKLVLEEHISRTDPIVHVSDIELAASTFFGITPADIHSSKKDRTVTLARSFSMFLA
ncbi:MAG: chromosomal replication initiator protein DnaA, partial [Sedimentisphaerales bacterium]|nr:chromosomal replication initiator protein DnaA [Sedimentisphaerales bacterium]